MEHDIECPICYDDITNSNIVELLPCQHKICYDCYTSYRVRYHTCPLDRSEIEFVKIGDEEPTTMHFNYLGTQQFYLDNLEIFLRTMTNLFEYIYSNYPILFRFPNFAQMRHLSCVMKADRDLYWKLIESQSEMNQINDLLFNIDWRKSLEYHKIRKKMVNLSNLGSIVEHIRQLKEMEWYSPELCVFLKLAIIGVANLGEHHSVYERIFEEHENKCITCGLLDDWRSNSSCSHNMCFKCIRLYSFGLAVNCPIHHVEL